MLTTRGKSKEVSGSRERANDEGRKEGDLGELARFVLLLDLLPPTEACIDLLTAQ